MSSEKPAIVEPALAEPVPAPKSATSTAMNRGLQAVISFGVFFSVLELIVRIAAVEPYIFPAPSAVVVALYNGLVSGAFIHAFVITVTEILAGFFIGATLGILLGAIMTSIPAIERLLYPYVVAFQTVPKVAIAPLLIIWFGFGIQSKIIIVAAMCLFPTLIGTLAGLRATDSDRIALVQSMNGTRWQLLRYVQMPNALPHIMAGLNTSIVLAVIGAIVGEFVGARSGIGVLIIKANFNLDLATVFALLVVLAVSGIALSSTLRYVDRKLCFWSGKATK